MSHKLPKPQFFPPSGKDLPENHLICDEREVYDPVMRRVSLKRSYGITSSSQGASPFAGLRNVPLITEMPDGSRKVVGTRIFDLIYQTWLPSQYLTLEGKYYEVVSISADGVLLRRAADHFLARHYYRQLRSYKLSIMTENPRADSERTFQGIKMSVERARVDVRTVGYLDMDDYGNIAGAHRIEVTSAQDRRYENKDLLRIVFDGASAEVTRTIAVVFSELLVTLFPKDHQYLAVLTSSGNALPEGILNQLEGSYAANEVFVVEDSSIDIGLVSAVERGMQRILETCFEFLDWHEEMLNKTAFSAGIEVGEPPKDAEDVDLSERELKARGLIARLVELLRGRGKGGKGGKGIKGGATPPSGQIDTDPQQDPTASEPDGGTPPTEPGGTPNDPAPEPVPEPKCDPTPEGDANPSIVIEDTGNVKGENDHMDASSNAMDEGGA